MAVIGGAIIWQCHRCIGIVAFTLAFTTLSLSFARAQDSACQAFEETRIGYVNIRKLMQSAPQVEQIRKKLIKEFEADRQKSIALRNQMTVLANEYDELSSNKNAAQQEKLQKIQEDIDQKEASLAKNQQKIQSAYNLRRNEEINKLQMTIVELVAKVAQEKKLVSVQNETAVLYVNACIDITPNVFAYLAEQPID